MRSNQVRKLVYVIGIGPGNFEQMTVEAQKALEQSDVIVGYTVYVDLLREHFPEKQFLTRVRPWPWSAAAMPACMACPG